LRHVVAATKGIASGGLFETNLAIAIVFSTKWTGEDFYVATLCSTGQGTGLVRTVEAAKTSSASSPMICRRIIETFGTNRVTYQYQTNNRLESGFIMVCPDTR
jgi:hypothetical protein